MDSELALMVGIMDHEPHGLMVEFECRRCVVVRERLSKADGQMKMDFRNRGNRITRGEILAGEQNDSTYLLTRGSIFAGARTTRLHIAPH